MEEIKKTEKDKALDLIERANLAALRQEEANKVLKDLLDRQEAMQTRQILGGQSEAGVTPVAKTAEDIANENARKQLEGSGYEDILFPKKE